MVSVYVFLYSLLNKVGVVLLVCFVSWAVSLQEPYMHHAITDGTRYIAGLPEYILPKWLLLVSTIATFSAAQSIMEHSFNRKVYTKGGASGMSLHIIVFTMT